MDGLYFINVNTSKKDTISFSKIHINKNIDLCTIKIDNDSIKLELNQKLEPIIAKETEDDSIMNQDKLNISLEFEKRQKPTIEAIANLMEDKLDYRFKNEDESEKK